VRVFAVAAVLAAALAGGSALVAALAHRLRPRHEGTDEPTE